MSFNPLLMGGNTALDITLQGTVGTFNVTKSTEDDSKTSLEVKYILTHVSLGQNNSKSKLLSLLAPVREIFNLNQLGVDELMQRDIEDSRVSLDLIPYLLDSSNSGLIKLFPPIVAVVLPLKPNSKRPDEYYKKVTCTEKTLESGNGYKEIKTTAGPLGGEQFEFIQHAHETIGLLDSGELKLSRDNSALAIVDGQHRAMALLALYRNLNNDWSDATKSPYEEFYKVWPEQEIRKYDLSNLNLPVMICTFPELSDGDEQNIDVIRAARKVFLTLNKSAKTVSDSRNKLLNDQDITSECLRETLSYIQNLGTLDNSLIRIWNVELDQEKDKTKIMSDVAFTGVSHLYTLIDQLILGNFAYGIDAKGKGGAPRRRLDDAYYRLNLLDELTEDQKSSNTKYNYSDHLKELFRNSWKNQYIDIIIEIFSKVNPYNAFVKASFHLKEDLADRRDNKLERILFEGQSALRIFDDFVDGVERRVIDNSIEWDKPEIREVLTRSIALIKNRNDYVSKMQRFRTKKFFESYRGSFDITSEIHDKLNNIFVSVFSTVAFQTALIATFTEAIIRLSDTIHPENLSELLEEYIESLNRFLDPKNDQAVMDFFAVFEQELRVENGEVHFFDVGSSFRDIILSGEMQPSEWPKFRYLLLELWNPTDEALNRILQQDREKCRRQVSEKLVQKLIRNYCKDNGIAEINLEESKKEEILETAKNKYENFLKALGVVDSTISDQILKSPPEDIDDFELEQG